MNALRFKKFTRLFVAFVALVVVFALLGCGSDGSDSMVISAGQNTGDTYVGKSISSEDVFNQHWEKVYVIGNITGTLAAEIEQIFVNRVPYDGISTDAPIIIAADSVQYLDDIQRNGVVNTFLNYYPIAVIEGSEMQINALLGILGLEQNYTLPVGKPYVELFAIDKEEENHTFTWSMYPPDEGELMSEDSGSSYSDMPTVSAYTDSSSDQLQRTGIFHGWIDNDKNRLTPEMKDYQQEAVGMILKAAEGESSELTRIAEGFVTTKNFSNRGNNYQLSYYIYSCHSFNATDATDYDWFYVRQEGMLNASGAYKGITKWGSRDYIDFYIGNYRMDNWMDSLTSQGSGVSLMAANPQNVNNVSQVTSGIDWNIGGSVGFQGKDITGSLNAGVTIHNSTTVNVSDCEVVNNAGDNVNNAKWRYEFKRAAETVYFATTRLSEPPVLSRSNFQPVNQWIWKFSPTVRDSNRKAFLSQLDVDLIETISGQPGAFWISGSIKHARFDGGSWKFEVPLTYPPLLVSPHYVDFSAAAQYKSKNIAVARNWTASSNQAWCRVEPAHGTGAETHINITVDANKTGASRTAKIKFKTIDGRGSDTMTVFQAQY
jgi:hypothetical protein